MPMTLIIASSDRLYDAILKTNIQLARLMRHIASLGLTVAEAKTEAVLFCRRKPVVMPRIKIGRTNIQVGDSMKYLGVIVDRSWNFKDHFFYLETKVTKVSRALNRLMPNLRGPCGRKRRLYASVVTSVVMYAAPVWSEALSASPDRILRLFRRLQRTLAIRVISAYRTVSYDAATVLARMPPWNLEAHLRRRVFERIRDLKCRGTYDLHKDREIRREEGTLLIRQWCIALERPGGWGMRTTSAISPCLGQWIERSFGELNFYSTQLFTGHGSFGHFLARIDKKESARCFHCHHDDDTLEHTLSECGAWDHHREELVRALSLRYGEVFSLGDVVEKILIKEDNWIAFNRFAVAVMKEKKEEERRREGASPTPSP